MALKCSHPEVTDIAPAHNSKARTHHTAPPNHRKAGLASNYVSGKRGVLTSGATLMTTQGPGQALYKQCHYRDASPKNQHGKKTDKEQLDMGEDQESQSHGWAGRKRGSEERSKSSKQKFLIEGSTTHSKAEGFMPVLQETLRDGTHFLDEFLSHNFSSSASP